MKHLHPGRRFGDHHEHQHDCRHARGDFWPGGEHGRGHGVGRDRGFGGGGLGRLFAHGDLSIVILYLIAEKPRHGYEIIKAIEDMAGGAYSPSPGTIYPALAMLEDQGYVTVETTDSNKKLHSITAEGRAHLERNRGAVETLLTRVAKVSAAQGDGPSPQIVRAVENLRLALRLRMSRGPLSEDQVRTVTEALDRAAGEIERS